MAGAATGDVAFAALLVTVAAGHAVAGAAAALVALATVLRWGTGSLSAVAGGQAVLGAAGWVGPEAAAVSAWLAAAALVAVPAVTSRLVAALGCGTLAALLVAGPSGGGSTPTRLGATAAAVACAAAAASWLPRRAGVLVCVVAGAGAVAAAVLA